MGALALALTLLTGCSGNGPELLADRSCQQDALPDAFERLTFGNLSPSELGRETGAAALERAGVEGGYFSFWKERRDALEDDVAPEIVCQVIAFNDDEAASRFVRELQAERDWLSVTVAGIALDAGTTVQEVAADTGEGEKEGVRAFQLEGADGTVRYAVVGVRERFVVSVHLGGAPGRVSVAETVAILATMGR